MNKITNNTFNDRNELFVEFVANDATVYESFESHEQDLDDRQRDPHLMDTSNDSLNQSQYCVNNCEKMINRLIADNEELKKMKDQLIAIEEQNVELIKDKQRSDSAMNHLRESFERKILLKNEAIDDLKKSLYIFESLNTSLHKELEEKRLQKQRLESYIKEIEDKLYFSEIQLIECQKSEECLLTSYNSARQAFTEEEDNKYKTLEQLQTAYVECAQQHNEIQELKQQISDLDREIADRDTDVNDDDMDHIFDDFNDNIPPKLSPITDESNEFQSLLESESENIEPNNSVANEENDKRVSTNCANSDICFL
ncbi:unnamed protein product [Medioppia subpectinata]|uniref:Uncharacterized protein n=1 Tax=Medioppia subpectinata TaxID=1979941 RepID=A0A7R9KQX2_9ACAR|nr:unnamed protein product [Medioppia subpectinata]CAG2106897.1 unnamed protein product [Medioppia subpectinata]